MVKKEVSCGKINLLDLDSQRSAYDIHAAYPRTKIPDIFVKRKWNTHKRYSKRIPYLDGQKKRTP
jgi:hypothetical protein